MLASVAGLTSMGVYMSDDYPDGMDTLEAASACSEFLAVHDDNYSPLAGLFLWALCLTLAVAGFGVLLSASTPTL